MGNKPWGLVKLVPPVLLLIFVAASYSNTLRVPFHFDDYPNIVDNPAIRIERLTPGNLFHAAVDSPLPSRPVSNLTFALNYYFGGLSPWGYHLVNLLIHMATALALYRLIRLLLSAEPTGRGRSPESTQRVPDSSLRWVAVAAAALWAVHPLQTQAVTYTVQRMTGLATLFSLLSLGCYLKARSGGGTRTLLRGCVVFFAMLAALGSKEIALTLPIAIVLCEVFFLCRFDPVCIRAIRGRLILLLLIPVVAAFAYLAALGGSTGLEGRFNALMPPQFRNFTEGERLLTEPRVVMHYLSLLAFPHPSRLLLDYAFPVSHSLSDPPTTLISIIGILALFAAPFTLARRLPLISFGLLWFLMNLLIESSFLPLDLVFEHRLYLPSIGLVIAGASLVERALLLKAPPLSRVYAVSAGTGMVIMLFTIWTYDRNMTWRDEFTLWSDTVAKAPQNARAHSNLGLIYRRAGYYDQAIDEFKKSLALKPDYADFHNNLGVAYEKKRMYDEALREYQTALRFMPDHLDALNNSAVVLAEQGKLDEAERLALRALEVDPDYEKALYNLGLIYTRKGMFDRAIQSYRDALRLKPGHAETHTNLGNIFYRQGKVAEAVAEWNTAIRADRKHAEAHYNLGLALLEQGNPNEAMGHFRSAIDAQNDYFEAYDRLRTLYVSEKRMPDAIALQKRLVDLRPQDPEAWLLLGNLMLDGGQPAESIEAFHRSLSLLPDQPVVHNNLGVAYIRGNDPVRAREEFELAARLAPQWEEPRKNLLHLKDKIKNGSSPRLSKDRDRGEGRAEERLRIETDRQRG